MEAGMAIEGNQTATMALAELSKVADTRRNHKDTTASNCPLDLKKANNVVYSAS